MDNIIDFAAQISLLIIMTQLYLAYRVFKADHERRKKQSTIEYINNVRQLWSLHKSKVDEKFGFDALTDKDIQQINSDDELKNPIQALLGQLEHVAVGMNTGVYDKDLLYRMSGAFLMSNYNRFKLFIEEAQKGNPFTYIEFQELVFDFQERRRVKPDPRGNIQYS